MKCIIFRREAIKSVANASPLECNLEFVFYYMRTVLTNLNHKRASRLKVEYWAVFLRRSFQSLIVFNCSQQSVEEI